MTISAELLEVLACPGDDHAPLRVEGDDALVCTSCESRFRIDDGVPVLLIDEAVPGPNGVGVPASGSA